MKYDVCLIADSPASVSSIEPLLPRLTNLNYPLVKISPYANYKLDGGVSVDHVLELRKSELNRIDNNTIIIYGTGSGHPRETNIPLYFKGNKCIAIHDILYLTDDCISGRNYHLPTHIIVPNIDVGKTLEKYFHRDKILYLGNPNLDVKNEKYHQANRIDHEKVIFISQPDGIEYSNPTSEDCINALQTIIKSNLFNIKFKGLHICLHPREDTNYARELSRQYPISFSVGDTLERIGKRCIVVGTGSAVLYESLLLGNQTFRITKEIDSTYKMNRMRLEDLNLIPNPISNMSEFLNLELRVPTLDAL